MPLTLKVDPSWMSLDVFHAMVALEEKGLPYKQEVVPSPIPDDVKPALEANGVLAALPMLVHDDFSFTGAIAISEYLAERFPIPDHPRIFPADLAQRARSRQVMYWLRSSFTAFYADRPTSNVFGRPTVRQLTLAGKAEAMELLRVAEALVKPKQTQLFDNWCIADADLALALMRLIGSQDNVPQHLVEYSLAQWDRRSIKRFVAHVPTTP
ncbi:MAG TPA: glutathione transferase [Kofleriaceae bacterium]|jgi:glutathione S-transferase